MAFTDFPASVSRHPDELYKNGIQRGSFIPAIELIKERFEIVDLDSETGRVLVPKCSLLSDPPLRKLDYRKLPRALSNVYYHPLDTATHTEMSKLFKAFAPDPVSDRKVSLAWGREMVVPESYEDVARLTFGDLCNRPLSAPDYLEISAHFGTVFVEGVPRMGVGERDQARRFITFIDGAPPSLSSPYLQLTITACYENKVCHIVCLL